MAIIYFLYGKGVPYEMAVQLFRACMKQREMNWWNTSIIITKHKNSKDVAHLDIYFKLKMEKHVYINGSQRYQLEIVDFLDKDEPKGIGFGNLYTNTIRKKIRRSREMQ